MSCVVAPPNITKQPTNITIQALQNATFTCEASGFEVKYKWKRHNNSIIIRNQSNLTISEATPLDEDQYYCVAMTEGGYAFSNNVTLRVDGKSNNIFTYDIIYPRDVGCSSWACAYVSEKSVLPMLHM